ncbi:MAG: hypothetical protein QM535_21050 [Limnohabitans sp.]|nr:hypothetical protein [Limnohabitans sp.]
MKYFIKITVIFVAAFLANATESKAQTGPLECKIHYGYDVSGNRIKREYKCESSWLPTDFGASHTIFTNVFPNPTTGVITGTFSEPIGGEAGGAFITVTTMGGIVVFQQEYNQVMSSVTIDISQQIPGQYLLTVAAFGKVESYVITKL